MNIIFTKHALGKFRTLSQLGFVIKTKFVKQIIEEPVSLDEKSDFPNKIATRQLSKHHILRVVYREESDKIIVITFYPARRGRYL